MRTLVALLVLTTSLGAGTARAAPGKKAEADQHFQAASRHYQAHEYEAAITEFEAAYALKPDPQILYNLGQSCRLAQRNECAIRYYRQYLSEVPDAPNRGVVEQRLAEVEAAQKPNTTQPVAPAPAPVVVAPAPVEKPSPDLPKTPYQLGARVRYIFVTQQMLEASFLTAATKLNSVSVGIEFVYRKPTYDVVTSLDFSWLPVEDGNYLGAGKEPAIDAQYAQFRNLSFISLDVSLIGHHTWAAAPWFELRYGAGLGVGAVLGDVLLTHDNGCTLQNVHDVAQCHPIGVDLTAANREAQLQATEAGGPYSKDTAGFPHRHISSDKPPAMGVLNLVVGFRFKLPKKITAQLEIGFRDAMFVGAGFHYLF